MKALYKTTIVIWSEYNPWNADVELSELARDAEEGESYCSGMTTILVDNPESDGDWDGTEFFGEDDWDDEDA
jgi:hypothetical protein